MPILENGEPLKINHCPNCNSRDLSYTVRQRDGSDYEVGCIDCEWKGDRTDLKVEEKPEPSQYV